MSNFMDDWKGTKTELHQVIDFVLSGIKENNYSDMTDKDFNKLFIEAFVRNTVQNELTDAMSYIFNEENK